MGSSTDVTEATPAETGIPFSYKDATEEEIIEDLTSRFILNLPDEELGSLERICFQIEQAHWYYEDFIREENTRMPPLPLKRFTSMLFTQCPVLQHWDHAEAYQRFMAYKTRVPVCGAIMLNDTWDKVVLVKGWKSSSGWGFPKGKQNEAEERHACATREVLEETGYNLAGQINPQHFIEINNKEQAVTLFIVPGVPEDYEFRTKTRKEISKIEWFRLADLPLWKRSRNASPSKFFLIAPFIQPLKAFIHQYKPKRVRKVNGEEKVPFSNIKAPMPVPKPPPESDSIQDSSSQSSSLDNGGPQTPSPQYTQSVPAIVGEQTEPSIPIESLDPHFAGLLSKLSLSAAPAPPPMTTVPLTQSVPQTSASPRTMPAAATAPAKPIAAPVSEQTPSTQAVMKILSPVSETNVPGANPNRSPMPAPSSPLSPMTRRSTTADISPYLSKPVEVPMSERRRQQLALLEAVAQESACRTPMLGSGPNGNPNTFGGPGPLAPASFHQPQASQAPNFYAGPPVPPPTQLNFSNSPSAQDFMMRSRTSQAFHRNGYQGRSGSMSMNQHQLLSLINGARLGASPPPEVPSLPTQSLGAQPMFNSSPRPYRQQSMQGLPPALGQLPLHVPYVANGLNATPAMDMNRPRPYSTAPMSMGPMPPFPSKPVSLEANPLLSLLKLGPGATQIPPIPEQATSSHPLPPL